jgi:hypothetical protein
MKKRKLKKKKKAAPV